MSQHNANSTHLNSEPEKIYIGYDRWIMKVKIETRHIHDLPDTADKQLLGAETLRKSLNNCHQNRLINEQHRALKTSE